MIEKKNSRHKKEDLNTKKRNIFYLYKYNKLAYEDGKKKLADDRAQ